ncbi:hypothetical protein L195_g028152, partial [Trifolium pratense]
MEGERLGAGVTRQGTHKVGKEVGDVVQLRFIIVLSFRIVHPSRFRIVQLNFSSTFRIVHLSRFGIVQLNFRSTSAIQNRSLKLRFSKARTKSFSAYQASIQFLNKASIHNLSSLNLVLFIVQR